MIVYIENVTPSAGAARSAFNEFLMFHYSTPCRNFRRALIEKFSFFFLFFARLLSNFRQKKECNEARKANHIHHSPNDLLLLFDMAACVVENNP